MTRERLFELAEHYHLTLGTERVTTGQPEGEAFRTFEFTGSSYDQLATAAQAIREARGCTRDFCCVRPSNLGGHFLEVSSFYCGPAL